MKVTNVADLVVETLERAGVTRAYGVVGDSLNGILDSVRKRGSIDWVHTRHEEAAAFAAGAQAHLTGELAVCAGSCGPGNLHLINGLFDAHRSRVPVLAIASHIPSSEIGSNYFQETHPQDLFRECSHYCEMISNPAQLPHVLETAIRAAISKRGVAVVVIPGDVSLLPAPERKPSAISGLLPSQPIITPSPKDVDALAALLNDAGKVTLFCGRGCQGAHKELLALAETLKAPIVHALGGKEYVEYDNPYDVGMTGLIGFSSGYHAMMDCDALLMIGTDFPYRQFYPKNAKIAQIDVRAENLGRRCPLELGVVAHASAAIAALLPKLEVKTDRKHLDHSLERYKKARKGLDDLAIPSPKSEVIHPQHVARLASELASDDAVFTFDVGTPTIWAARYLKMNGKRRLIGSLAHGSMANALPQAIGAQSAFPDRQIISLSGDGGFTMMMGDFITLSQQGLPVKVIVFNNGTLGFVEMEMKAYGMLETGVDLKNPDFAAMARAMGIHGVRAQTPDELEAGMRSVLEHKGPALLDAVTNRFELSMPPKIELEQAKGFSLYMMKAVMDGRGGEVIDLARSNIMR